MPTVGKIPSASASEECGSKRSAPDVGSRRIVEAVQNPGEYARG
jgi:hypothetical protein